MLPTPCFFVQLKNILFVFKSQIKYFYALKLQLDHTEIKPSPDGYSYENIEVNKVITLINKTKFIIND